MILLPEGFMNELYEIIDHRATEDITTLFTSNVGYGELTAFVGDRIVSRIQGMCGNQVILKGNDNRVGGLF
jgi:DNA replication protein DnaC